MFLKEAIRSGMTGRRTAIFATTMVALMSVPVIMYSFPTSPPTGNTGAPGQGTCSSCHGTLTTPSAITVNAPSTYTPGGAAVSMTVSIPSAGAFELAILTQSGNAQAGTLTADIIPPGASFVQTEVVTSGSIQYVDDTVSTTSWSFHWTPPTTNVGNVVVYVTGGTYSTNYENSYTITPAVTTPPPPPPTITVSPTSLTFNVSSGTVTPASGTISVTSCGAPIAYTTRSLTA